MTEPKVQIVGCDSLEALPRDLCPGAVLLVMDATGVAADAIGSVARQFLEGPLRVVACWGPDCERVHDIFEQEEVVAGIDRIRPAQSQAVISTWHATESISQALRMLQPKLPTSMLHRPI